MSVKFFTESDFWHLHNYLNKNIKRTETCWLWIGTLNQGYGRACFKDKMYNAHRFVLELANIDIPKGMVVDHICRVRNCVNPDHLRVVTVTKNTLENSEGVSALNAKKTKCKRGHQFSATNTQIRMHSNGKTSRNCIKCRAVYRSRDKQYYKNKKARVTPSAFEEVKG